MAQPQQPTGVTVHPMSPLTYGRAVNYPTVTNWEVSSHGRLRLEADNTGIAIWAEGTWHHLDDHGTPAKGADTP
jgi:hypothetical protein